MTICATCGRSLSGLRKKGTQSRRDSLKIQRRSWTGWSHIYTFQAYVSLRCCNKYIMDYQKNPMPVSILIPCRFHVSNHVCPRCKTKYNPYKHACTDNMNTEVCEQTFRWWGRMAGMLNSMTPNRFKFTTYHLINDHNKRLVTIWKAKKKPIDERVIQI